MIIRRILFGKFSFVELKKTHNKEWNNNAGEKRKLINILVFMSNAGRITSQLQEVTRITWNKETHQSACLVMFLLLCVSNSFCSWRLKVTQKQLWTHICCFSGVTECISVRGGHMSGLSRLFKICQFPFNSLKTFLYYVLLYRPFCLLCGLQEGMDRNHLQRCAALFWTTECERYWEPRTKMSTVL